MKNAEKILTAMEKAFTGHKIEILFNFIEKKYSIYLDEQYVGNFEEWFLKQDFDNPEIEIKIKAPLKNIEKFIANNYINNYGVREAVERGLKEWEEGSRANN